MISALIRSPALKYDDGFDNGAAGGGNEVDEAAAEVDGTGTEVVSGWKRGLKKLSLLFFHAVMCFKCVAVPLCRLSAFSPMLPRVKVLEPQALHLKFVGSPPFSNQEYFEYHVKLK